MLMDCSVHITILSFLPNRFRLLDAYLASWLLTGNFLENLDLGEKFVLCFAQFFVAVQLKYDTGIRYLVCD